MKSFFTSTMKFFTKNLSTIILLCIIFSAAATATADKVYSTADDPLVSMSYLNAQIEKAKAEIKGEMLVQMEKYVNEEVGKLGLSGSNANSVVFRTESLKSGQKIVALGSCDFILLTGSANAVCPSETQLLLDKTTEAFLKNNDQIIKNHYIVIQKADGRGVCATSSGTEIMIKGEYKVIG